MTAPDRDQIAIQIYTAIVSVNVQCWQAGSDARCAENHAGAADYAVRAADAIVKRLAKTPHEP
jgi:hypothetical protein